MRSQLLYITEHHLYKKDGRTVPPRKYDVPSLWHGGDVCQGRVCIITSVLSRTFFAEYPGCLSIGLTVDKLNALNSIRGMLNETGLRS